MTRPYPSNKDNNKLELLNSTTIAAIKNNIGKFDLFSIIRRIESVQGDDIALVGESVSPNEEIIEIFQNPSLGFAYRNIDSIEFKDNKFQIATNEIGLLGPNSPLPLHLIEYIFQRKHQHGDWVWASFVSLLQHRIITMFYRSWKNAQSVISLEDGADSKFNRYISSIVGLAGLKSNPTEDNVNYFSKLYFSGFYLQRNQSKDNFENLLTQYFKTPIRILENIGKWFEVDPQERMCLGCNNYKLGDGLIVGKYVYHIQTKFRIKLGPLTLEEFESFMKSGSNYLRLKEWVQLYVGEQYDWELQLTLEKPSVPLLTLDGKKRLGLTSWLGEVNRDPNDVIIKQ